MMPTFKKGVAITERDEKLFRYLFVNKVATNIHLQADIFKNASKQAIHRRLDKLIKGGFIEASYLRSCGNRLAYSLSKKALLNFIGGKKDLQRLQRKSSAITHDLGLLEIKKQLSKCKLVENYLSENILACEIFDDESDIREIKKIHPDAIVKVKQLDHIFYFPLEYEASPKFAKRYDKLITRYYLMEEVKAVLFICKNITIQKKVMQAERKKCSARSGKFFYCLYENVMKLGEKVQFINNQKEVLISN